MLYLDINLQIGVFMPLTAICIGTMIHNIEVNLGQGSLKSEHFSIVCTTHLCSPTTIFIPKIPTHKTTAQTPLLHNPAPVDTEPNNINTPTKFKLVVPAQPISGASIYSFDEGRERFRNPLSQLQFSTFGGSVRDIGERVGVDSG